ncbi:growth arrest-specific protein 7-like [Sinocyclocheilus rhinocerous]|uniref:growth arrest-specific protein 7-like n=1 Tax=Sinocyclocheilus rhinocerous TaxID=307959 RepID=UPI0007BA2E0A|nr:PREDICTED: growth arrest-specific protein 7-like [Sinocyclocheilus rhinocerous]
MSGSFCRSLYAFTGDQHQQGLKFEAGELIRITQTLDGGWWEGEKDGVKGWFPSTYVQLQNLSSMSPLDEPLARDWKCYMSPQGRRYYVNTVSNETTWERPSSTPGTPKTAAKHKNSVPTVNGFHGNGSPLHQTEPSLVLMRKTSTDHQSPVSTSPSRKQECESTVTIHSVTFPLPLHMSEQQLLKPDEWSYCDYFWADRKDPQGSAIISGFEVLLQKQLKGRQMQKEMAEFVRERIRIEEEYAKNLSKLSQIPLAAQEEGTLGSAWAQLKKSLADEAEVHLKFSSKLQSEVEKPLLIFRENFKKDMKKFDHHMSDLRKQLASRSAAVEKARKALADRQKDLELKTQHLEIKLNSKIEEDIKKARRKSTQAGDDLMRCVDLYNQSQSKWFEEMVTSSLELEHLEVERVEMIRQHLCQYTTLRHETDMFNQSTIEPVDKLLRSVDPARDRELWVREHKTGELRPVDMDI